MTPHPVRASSIDWTCPVCKMTARVPGDFVSVQCACGYQQQRNPAGLGDRLAAWLARIGITERRYCRAKAALGLKPRCRCKQRQERLNDA